MGTSKHTWIGLAVASAVLLASLTAWRFSGGRTTELAPQPAAERSAPAHVEQLTAPEEFVARVPTKPIPAPNLRGVRLSDELLERLKTPEAEAGSVLAVQWPADLAGSRAWLQVAREGEEAQTIGAEVGPDGLANFHARWTGPADLLLGTDSWIGDPAKLYVPNPTGYFDARPEVHVAHFAVRVPEGSEAPKSLHFSCMHRRVTFVELELPPPEWAGIVGFALDEVDVRLSAYKYRDQELTVRPGHYQVELQPGVPVQVELVGLDPAILAKDGATVWLFQGDRAEVLILRSTITQAVLPSAGSWKVSVLMPFSWDEIMSASTRPAWFTLSDSSDYLSGGGIASPPVFHTTIHVDEMDAQVTLEPVWEEQ